jgi:hypothetical protein
MNLNPASRSRPADITLPPADRSGGLPLMQALQCRASNRRLSSKPLPDSVLSNLLWAASGVNRPESGRRTSPSASNWQEIDLYVVRPEGAFLYYPHEHRLIGVAFGDFRPYAGIQAFVAKAPAVLVYVANLAKMVGADEDGRRFYPPCDSGFVSAHVYLACASEGLATTVLISVDKPVLHEKLGLGPDQAITLSQPIGYPEDV